MLIAHHKSTWLLRFSDLPITFPYSFFYTMWFFICIKANKIQISLNQFTEGYVLSQPSMLNPYRSQTSDCRTHQIVQRLSEKC